MRFPCDVCEKSFDTKTGLANHKRSHNQDQSRQGNERTSQKADQSPKRTTQQQNNGTDTKGFPCNECGKYFPSRKGLANHMRTHKKENKELQKAILKEDETTELDFHKLPTVPTTDNILALKERSTLDGVSPNDIGEGQTTSKAESPNGQLAGADGEFTDTEYQNSHGSLENERYGNDSDEKFTPDLVGAANDVQNSSLQVDHQCKKCERSFQSTRSLSNHMRTHFERQETKSSTPPLKLYYNDLSETSDVTHGVNEELQTDNQPKTNEVLDTPEMTDHKNPCKNQHLVHNTSNDNQSNQTTYRMHTVVHELESLTNVSSMNLIDQESENVASGSNLAEGHQCDKCGRSFQSNRSLSIHKRTHFERHDTKSSTPPLKCDEMDVSNTDVGKNDVIGQFNKLTFYDYPIVPEITEKGYTISQSDHETDSAYSSFERIQIDQKTYKVENGKEKIGFPCNECGKCFPTKTGLANHMRTHKKGYKQSQKAALKEDETTEQGFHNLKTSNFVNGDNQLVKSGCVNQSVNSLQPEIQNFNLAEDNRIPRDRKADVSVQDDDQCNSVPNAAGFDYSAQGSSWEAEMALGEHRYESDDAFYSFDDEDDDDDDDDDDDILNGDNDNDKWVPPSPSVQDKVKEDRTPVYLSDEKLVDGIIQDNRLSLKRTRQSVKVVEGLITKVINELKKDAPDLQWSRFNSGSYYDRTKNSSPDEFDIMIMPKNIQLKPDFDSSEVKGFYKVLVETPRLDDNFKQMMRGDYIHPKDYKDYVFGVLDKIFESGAHPEFRSVQKKPRTDDNSPAYTIIYNRIPGHPIDIDLVPSFRIDGWPIIARKIDPKWIKSDKVVNKAVESYDIVAKACPDTHVKDHDLLWRLSFCYTEKKLITSANDGNRCSNRKSIFRILKRFVKTVKDRNPEKVKKFCSYHIKQFMLYQYENNWKDAEKVKVLRAVLENFIEALSASPPSIENYFIQGDNVIRYVPQTEINLIIEHFKEELKTIKRKE